MKVKKESRGGRVSEGIERYGRRRLRRRRRRRERRKWTSYKWRRRRRIDGEKVTVKKRVIKEKKGETEQVENGRELVREIDCKEK